ncbi:hypothetical protein SLEP1_g11883 [Rubroshorea leprosula]|nr:hypothetical protein SLEP1_g11883 [Rubroshorea leprosula]
MTCQTGFSSNYMLLKPNELKFMDLFHILFSSDIQKGKFMDCSHSSPTREVDSFRHRWIIFISIVAQKFLMFMAKPIAGMGWLLEKWLNLLHSNGNFGRLLVNLVRGNVESPDKEGENFISFIGNLDRRVELDRSIKHEDGSRYYAALAMMASKASYENKAYIQKTVTHHWKMEFLEFFDYWNDFQEKATTQAFLLHDKNNDHDTIVVAFRGTEPFDADAWCSDFDLSWYELPNIGKIHGGFMKALGLQKNDGWPNEPSNDNKRSAPLAYYAIREKLRELLSGNDQTKFILTGHSLGGSLAILFPAILAFHKDKTLLERLEGVYTFGQPRVGDEHFGQHMQKTLKENGIRYFRFVYGSDIVPRLPYDDKDLMFKHFGTCLYFDRHYKGKVITEEPNKNYFSPIGAIRMKANAFMELIRSFTISHSRGREYKEGWLLRGFRIIGLVIPGIPAHCPQDYVNATRLGPSDLFLSHA